MSDFYLRKWYLDAADGSGNAYIGYRAMIQWKGLVLHYYQHLWLNSAGGLTSRAGLSKEPEPTWRSKTELGWNTEEVQASWCGGERPFSETLLANENGQIDWTCFQPWSHAEIQSQPLSLSGWGYTECIELTIPPWKLPLKTLYWGRAHSDHHYMVWIKWDGPTSQSLLWHDGKRDTELDLTDDAIHSPHIAFEVENKSTIREGPLGSTVFRPFERIATLFPYNALLIEEHKWYGTGHILAGNVSEPATVIYERVTW